MVSPDVTASSPTLAPSWQWQSWEGLPYLTCSLLQSWSHGFFTRQFRPRMPEELVEVLQSQAQAYRTQQVHGRRVVTPSEMALAVLDNVEADGILTERSHQAVWVATADCTPALIGDLETGRVAAVHAGWRGTAQRILPEAIARLLAVGSSLENLRIAMGPAIAGEVYQVSEPVAAQVGASIIPSQQADSPGAILEALRQLPDSPLLDDPQPRRVRLDVRRVNALQLQKFGITPEQIAIAPYCTYQQPEDFFSYRRCKENKIQWSGIISHSATWSRSG